MARDHGDSERCGTIVRSFTMHSSYARLATVIVIDAILMFLTTYSMIASASHFHLNINRLYMTLMMVAPMIVLMLAVMHRMFPSRRLNISLYAGAVLLFAACFILARQQVPVGNEQFLRSMIPHHSSAILMCNEADISDPEIVRLCGQIIESQEREIAQMEQILARY